MLAGSYLPSLKWPALILFVGGGAGLIALYIKKEAHLPFSDLSDLFVPVCLLIQCKRPYYRVFTYGGAVLSLLFMVLAGYVLEKLKRKVR